MEHPGTGIPEPMERLGKGIWGMTEHLGSPEMMEHPGMGTLEPMELRKKGIPEPMERPKKTERMGKESQKPMAQRKKMKKNRTGKRL